jgi:hypothetical protein
MLIEGMFAPNVIHSDDDRRVEVTDAALEEGSDL